MQPLTPPPPAHVLRRPTPPAAASTMPPPPPPPSASCNRAAPPPLRPPPELPLPSALVPPKKRRVFRTPPKATTPLPPPPPPAPVPVAVAVQAPSPPPHAESPLFSAQKPPPPPPAEKPSSPSPRPPPPPPAEKPPSPPPPPAEHPSSPPFAEEPFSPPPLTLPLPPPPPAESPNSPPPPPAGNPNSPPPRPAETPSSSFPPLPPPSAADEKPSAPPLTDPAEEPAPAPKTRKVTRTVRRRVRKGTIAARKAAADAASAAAAAGASQPGKGHAPDNSSRNAAAADELVQKEQSIGGNTIEKPASSCNPVAVCETQLGKEMVAGGTLTDKPATDIGGEHEMEKKLGNRGESRAEVGMSERQRRMMTEVFVGGLNRDAKEDDVRAALSVAGEITEVRMIMEGKTKKNKGYCFVRYREAAQARKAIARFGNVKICGKQCRVAALGGNDKIFLGNIDRKWKKEDIVKLLQKIGVENIDVVTLLPDSNNPGHNRGFAFLELETYRDAQIAYRKLSRKDVFGKGLNIRVDWAEPLNDPDENQMQKVKAVFVDGVPNSWDQAKLTEIFKKYGKVELVALSRDMRRAKRNDFALVHFYTHEAAILCLESFDGEQLTENGSKIDIRVSLAKPVQKGKNNMDNHKFCISQKDETKTAKSEKKLGPSSLHILSSYSRAVPISGYKKSSTTHGFVQVLRELAPWRHGHTGSGSLTQNYPRILSGEKRPFSALGIDSYSMNHSLDGQHERNTYATSTSSYSVSPPAITQCSPPYHHESRRCVLDSDSVLAEPWGGNQMRQASSRKPEGCDMTAGTNRDGLSLTDCSLR